MLFGEVASITGAWTRKEAWRRPRGSRLRASVTALYAASPYVYGVCYLSAPAEFGCDVTEQGIDDVRVVGDAELVRDGEQ